MKNRLVAGVSGIGRRKGSALLIVLGFLSFMIVSGVSFAIYMRIERQASSNYRHATTARHLLNSALFRAMDEIDSELRLKNASGGSGGSSALGPRKFPTAWKGRVRASASANASLNSQNAHVLSMESLSFLPPFLINDVRRYAIWQSGDQSYMGAKWSDLERASDGSVVGRYAYVCVNISDMLDVNSCRTSQRETTTNRVTIGHLFDTDADRRLFDKNREKDVRYFSLQDFYAARYNRSPTAEASAYHHYLKTGKMTDFENEYNLDRVFSCDSIVKAEPTASGAFNMDSDSVFVVDFMMEPRPTDSNQIELSPSFAAALQKAVQDDINNGDARWDGNSAKLMGWLIKDYLDYDPVPTRLDAPCVEMAPMISQIVIANDGENLEKSICPEVFQIEDKSVDPSIVKYGIRMVNSKRGGSPYLSLKLEFPFKYYELKQVATFKIKGRWHFQIVKAAEQPDWVNMGAKPNFELKSRTEDALTTYKPSQDYKAFTLLFDAVPPANEVLLIDEKDKPLTNFFGVDDLVRVVCTVWLQVTVVYDGREYAVDQIPCVVDMPQGTYDEELAVALQMWRTIPPKLTFQTDPVRVGDLKSQAQNRALTQYTYNILETPDARFNYHPANWVASLDYGKNAVDETMNPSTATLTGLNGRDADPYLFVANTGKYQSPGELGYIIRPFKRSALTTPVDFETDNKLGINYNEKLQDGKNMFRTVRLYDHGENNNSGERNRRRHDVYKYFYSQGKGGALTGARVNPLSDMPEILEGAIWDTPLDYWFTSPRIPLLSDVRKVHTFNRRRIHFADSDHSAATTTGPSTWDDKWIKFKEGWTNSFSRVVGGSTIQKEINKEWKNTLSDYYGDWDYFKWYSPEKSRIEIFDKSVGGSSSGPACILDNPLHEIDRKMLYSFSLDSFSDRQQLFLFFIRAESTAPAFGSGVEGGMRSLAGGRAVALVWRDPYPGGYEKSPEKWSKRAGIDGWYPRLNSYTSPWRQYGSTNKERWDGWHDMRVLFFKQLDQ